MFVTSGFDAPFEGSLTMAFVVLAQHVVYVQVGSALGTLALGTCQAAAVQCSHDSITL